MGFDPQQPHDDLPTLPPRAEVETKAVLRQCVAASREGASKMISSAPYVPTTCPFSTVFYPYPLNMSNAWTHCAEAARLEILSEGNLESALGYRVAANFSSFYNTNPHKSRKSGILSNTPVPDFIRRRYYTYSKPGGPLSQDTHTSSGLSISGLGVGA